MDDLKSTQNIMILLKKKQSFIQQLLNCTNDISDSMSHDDFDSLNMLLDMRASLMNDVDICDQEIQNSLSLLSDEARIRVSCQLSDAKIKSDVSFEESKIKELQIMIKSRTSKIIEINKFLEIQIDAKRKLLSLENS